MVAFWKGDLTCRVWWKILDMVHWVVVQLSNSDGGNHHLPALGTPTLRLGNHVEGKTQRAVEAVNDSQLLLVEFHNSKLSRPTSSPVVAPLAWWQKMKRWAAWVLNEASNMVLSALKQPVRALQTVWWSLHHYCTVVWTNIGGFNQVIVSCTHLKSRHPRGEQSLWRQWSLSWTSVAAISCLWGRAMSVCQEVQACCRQATPLQQYVMDEPINVGDGHL